MGPLRLQASHLAKTFTLHQQGGISLPVFERIDLGVHAGECLVLEGTSGTGKSTLLRCLYGNYRADQGSIEVEFEDRWVDLVTADARLVGRIRQGTVGYVSQFLRVIPRIPTLDLVCEPLRQLEVTNDEARDRAAAVLKWLQIPERLWQLPPATFSGGEQQRVNIACGLIVEHPILLLDEPTASLDADNQQRVIELIDRARARGSAIVGIFHDESVRDAVASRRFPMTPICEHS